jgi:16S rRNA (uracil1498-N3)-methyltransferase
VTPPSGDPSPVERPDAENFGWAAAEDAAAHVFVDALADAIEIAGADGHHLQRVRRLRVGEHLTAADGAGTWRRYEVAAIDPGRLGLYAVGTPRREPEMVPGVALAVALTKAGALDTVVARCTELGVASVTPVRTRRCVVRWDAAQAGRARERLQVAAREAAMQSRRARLPGIEPVVDLDDLLTAGRATSGQPMSGLPVSGLVVADRTGGPVADLVEPAAGTWTVVVGPEGGLEPAELEALAGVPRLGLGPHILRAETAPIAAVALLLSRSHQMFREW